MGRCNTEQSKQKAPLPPAVCLAAGFGKRMRPLSNDTPKPLITVAGRTMLDQTIDKLIAAGVTTIIVNGHYLGDQIEQHITARNAKEAATLIFSDERDEIKDSGGGVKRALAILDHAEHDAVMILNGDQVWQEEPPETIISKLWDTWLEYQRNNTSCEALLACVPLDSAYGYDGMGDFVLDETNHISRLAAQHDGGTQTPYIFMGLSILPASWFKTETQEVFSLNRFFDRAIANSACLGLTFKGTWYHIGTPQAHNDAEKRLLRTQPPSLQQPQ